MAMRVVHQLSVGGESPNSVLPLPPHFGECRTRIIEVTVDAGFRAKVGLPPHAIEHVLPTRFGEDVELRVDVKLGRRPETPPLEPLVKGVGYARAFDVVAPEGGVAAPAQTVVQLDEVERALVTLRHHRIELTRRSLVIAAPGKEVRHQACSDFGEDDAGGFERLKEAARKADGYTILVPVDLAKARVELEAARLQSLRSSAEIGAQCLLGAAVVGV